MLRENVVDCFLQEHPEHDPGRAIRAEIIVPDCTYRRQNAVVSSQT
jgi:hypothetical protein